MRQNSNISDIIYFPVSLHQLSRYKKDVLTIDAQEIVAEQEATASNMIPMDAAMNKDVPTKDAEEIILAEQGATAPNMVPMDDDEELDRMCISLPAYIYLR